jgi:hypothetical protein
MSEPEEVFFFFTKKEKVKMEDLTKRKNQMDETRKIAIG